jgi:Leucine-rich repeat (LRR) protein
LGVVLYQLCTGQLPFQGDNFTAVLTALAVKTPVPPREINPNLSPRMAALIERLLAKDREQRPASAKAVADELAQIEKEAMCPAPEVITEHEREPLSPAPSKPRRRLRVATGLVALVASLVAAVFFIRNPNGKGMVRIETVDKDVEVRILHDGKLVKSLDKKTGQEVELPVGEYKVELKPGKRGLTLETDTFTIKRNGVVVVKVSPVPPPPPPPIPPGITAASSAKPSTEEKNAAKWVLSVGGKVEIENNTGQKTTIAALTNLPKKSYWSLNGVDLRDAKVSDADLKHIDKLTNITWVNLPGNISNAGLVHIKGLKGLKSFAPPGTNVDDAGLENLKGLTQLEILDLRHMAVSNAGLKHLEGLTNLKRLYLRGPHVGDAGLEHLEGMIKLEELWLTDLTEVTNAGLESLKRMTNLKFLRLDRSRGINGAGLVNLKGLTNLEELHLWETQVSDAGLKYLKALTKLKILDLAKTNVSNEGLNQLKDFANLELLALEDTSVSDAGLELFKGRSKLTEIQLTRTKVTDRGLEYLAEMKNLRTLYLRGTKVSDAGLEHLKGLTNLKELHLEGSCVTAAGVAALRKALPRCAIGWTPAK